jgi:2-oxoglutarate ferredoxin oxidoreductase subunit alpha
MTESGISPRSIPGMKGAIFTATGLEHSETGLPNYTAENHMKMSEKRHRKIYGALEDLFSPEEFSTADEMEVGIISWGSTFGAALEAVKQAQGKGLRIGALKVSSIFPYHEKEIREFMNKCEEVLIPELNYEGQLANLIGHLHRKDVVRMNQATGIPIVASAILKEIETLL